MCLECAALTKKGQEVRVLVVWHRAGGNDVDILTWLKAGSLADYCTEIDETCRLTLNHNYKN